jgi:hypothetical protein
MLSQRGPMKVLRGETKILHHRGLRCRLDAQICTAMAFGPDCNGCVSHSGAALCRNEPRPAVAALLARK